MDLGQVVVRKACPFCASFDCYVYRNKYLACIECRGCGGRGPLVDIEHEDLYALDAVREWDCMRIQPDVHIYRIPILKAKDYMDSLKEHRIPYVCTHDYVVVASNKAIVDLSQYSPANFTQMIKEE